MAELAVILVLYKQTPAQSVTLSSFLEGARGQEDRFALLIYDNGPEDQSALLPQFPGLRYVHDSSNGMLYAAYSHALAMAREAGLEWLMLLDQDTALTPAYLAEALALCRQPLPAVCACVPRLMIQGSQRSPHALLARDQPREATLPTGPAPFRLGAWNSGAMLRVESMVRAGQFPAEFPLDNLDYAVFTALQSTGETVYVMGSSLVHQLSVAELDTLSPDRLKKKLASDLLLQQRFGLRTRQQLAWEFFRTGVSLLRKLPDKQMGWLCLRYSVRCFSRPPGIADASRQKR